MSKITIKPLPSGVVASWRSKLSAYSELGEKLMSIVQPEMQRLGCEGIFLQNKPSIYPKSGMIKMGEIVSRVSELSPKNRG